MGNNTRGCRWPRLALDGKTCATTAEQLPEYCATIVLQLPSKDLSAYAYFVTALDTSARMYKTKKRMIYYFAYTSLNCISGFALDTSARQSNEKFFTLFLAFALA